MAKTHKGALPTESAKWITVMGADQGGYHACLKIIPYIPKNIPTAILVVQEMPVELTKTFCNYLNHYSRIHVKPLEGREKLLEGVCYICNHEREILLEQEGMDYYIQKGNDSVDSVFGNILSKIAKKFAYRSIGIALTGKLQNSIAGLQAVKKMEGL